jgi:tetratricopeptide (TPR) repeat protein
MIKMGTARSIRNSLILFFLLALSAGFMLRPPVVNATAGDKLVPSALLYRVADIGILELKTITRRNDFSRGIDAVKQLIMEKGKLSNYERYYFSRLLIKNENFREAEINAARISNSEKGGFLRYVALAEIKVARGSLKEASALYRAAGDAGFSGGYYLAALCEMQIGNYTKARALLSRIKGQSVYFGRGIEKRTVAHLAANQPEKGAKLIEDSLPLLKGTYPVDHLELLILLGKIYINEEKAEICLKMTEKIAGQIQELEKQTEKSAVNLGDIGNFPSLAKVIEQYLSRKSSLQTSNSYWDLSGYYVGWVKNLFLTNSLLSFERTALLFRHSVQKELKKIEKKIAVTERKREEIDKATIEVSGMRQRINGIIDNYPIEELFESEDGEKAKVLIQSRLDEIEQIDITVAKLESLIERVKNNPLYEKMDVEKKTTQNKAISEFLRLKKDIHPFKTEAGILRVRLMNLLKEPVLLKSTVLVKRAETVRQSSDRAGEILDGLSQRLFLAKKYVLLQIKMSDRTLRRIRRDILLARKLDTDLRKRYGEIATKTTDSIMEYLRGKKALFHYLRGRAYVHYLQNPDKYSRQLDSSPIESASREFKTALDLGIYPEYRPECYYALAEILMAKEEEEFARNMDIVLKREEMGEDVTEPVIAYSESLSYFQKIITEYPGSVYYKNALYSYAYAKNEMGKVEEGTRIYEELIKKYPKTRYADEINMRIGEYYFNREKFRKAEDSYRKVVGKTNREILATSKFKLGWALYNQERYEEAVSAFIIPLKLRDKGEKLKFARLAEELLIMLAKCYIEMGKIRMLGRPLEKAGLQSLIPPAFLKEVRILFDTSRFDEVIEIAGLLREKYPFCLELLESEDLAAKSYLKLLKEEDGYRRYYETVLIFGSESEWFRKNSAKEAWLELANKKLEENLRISAFFYYNKGRETEDKGYFKEAIEVFRSYLKNAPNSAYATDIRYNLAYSLYEVGSYKSASRIFEKLALSKSSGNLGESSLYMTVQCAKAMHDPDHRESVEEIIRTTRTYLANFPKGERKVEITADLASALFNGGMYEETVAVAQNLENETDNQKILSLALKLKGESYFNLNEYGQSEESFRVLLKVTPSKDAEGKKKIMKYIGFSIFKNAQSLSKMKKLSRAGEEYLRLFNEFPELDFSPIAALEGGKSLYQLGKIRKGKEIFEKVARAYPGTPYEKEARRQIALISEKSGDFEEAARNYRLIGEDMGKNPEGATYLKKAGQLFFEMGSYVDAGSTYMRLENNPQTPTNIKIEAAYYAGLSFIKAGNTIKGVKLLEKAVRLNRSAPEKGKNSHYAALSQFEIAATDFDRYRNIKIKEPFEITFRKKEKGLGRLLNSYMSIAKYGIPETLSASLYQIGEVYEEFRNAILAAPIPPGLSDVEHEEYIFLLEEKAAPYEEEASLSHESNLRKAAKFGYFNVWVKKSWEKLKEMRGATFGRKPVNPLIIVPKSMRTEFISLGEVAR